MRQVKSILSIDVLNESGPAVAHGILLTTLHPEEASRLIAASRIASSTLSHPKIKPGPKTRKPPNN